MGPEKGDALGLRGVEVVGNTIRKRKGGEMEAKGTVKGKRAAWVCSFFFWLQKHPLPK